MFSRIEEQCEWEGSLLTGILSALFPPVNSLSEGTPFRETATILTAHPRPGVPAARWGFSLPLVLRKNFEPYQIVTLESPLLILGDMPDDGLQPLRGIE